MELSNQEQDCAICLQKYHHPTKLPCGHVFCFLCVKGIAMQSKKCAMCRMLIPADYFEHPVLIRKTNEDESYLENISNKYQWYYEGRNGWWKYDERSNIDLETAYSSEETECLLLLAGTIYCVDFQNMIQFRRGDPRRRRKVKRDIPTLPAKGIAGIKNVQVEQQAHLNNTNTLTEIETDEGAYEIEINSESGGVNENLVTTTELTRSIEEMTENLRQTNMDPDSTSLDRNDTDH